MSIGKKHWAIAEGWIPLWSHGPEPAMLSHETACILNANDVDALHIAAGCSARPFRHAEYFHDHVRIESMLFDGVPQPENGALKPDLTRPGMVLEFKHADAQQYKIL